LLQFPEGVLIAGKSQVGEDFLDRLYMVITSRLDRDFRKEAGLIHPVITLCEDANLHSLMTFDYLENPDLFRQFARNPEAFLQFLRNHWDEVYTLMSLYQLQHVNPALYCPAIHVIPIRHGKQTAQIVEKLLGLRDILNQRFGFHVAELAFDGDSSFNILHSEFEEG
jgi:hypothetical protein